VLSTSTHESTHRMFPMSRDICFLCPETTHCPRYEENPWHSYMCEGFLASEIVEKAHVQSVSNIGSAVSTDASEKLAMGE
jgi:hypothetical protein